MSEITPIVTEETQLCSHGHDLTESSLVSVKAHLFGQMVRRARPIHEHYLGDIYHDALWIDKRYNEVPFSFTWGFSESHTSIGDDTDEARQIVLDFNEVVYRIEVYTTERGNQMARWDLLKGKQP